MLLAGVGDDGQACLGSCLPSLTQLTSLHRLDLWLEDVGLGLPVCDPGSRPALGMLRPHACLHSMRSMHVSAGALSGRLLADEALAAPIAALTQLTNLSLQVVRGVMPARALALQLPSLTRL